jgi:O-antigen/teichoic acid export membrane protein
MIHNNFVKSVFHYVSSGVIGTISVFLSSMLIGRWYGPDFFGKLNVLTIYGSILAHVSSLGTGQAFLMEISKLDNPIKRSKLVISLTIVYSLFPLLCILLLTFFKFPLDKWLFITLILLDVGLFKSVRERLILNIMRVNKDNKGLYIINLLGGLGRLIIVLLIYIFWGENYELLLLSSLLFISALTTIFGYSRLIINTQIKLVSPSMVTLLDIYRKGLPFFLVTLTVMGNDYASTLILNSFSSSLNVGIYSAAYKVISLFILFFGLISQGIFPDLRQNYIKRKYGEFRKRLVYILLFIILISFCSIIFFFVFSDLLIHLIYGEKYIDSSKIIYILSFMLIGSGINMVVFVAFQIMDMQNIVFRLSLVSGTLNILMNLLFVPKLEHVGAAIASTFSMVLSGVISIIVLYIVFNKMCENN